MHDVVLMGRNDQSVSDAIVVEHIDDDKLPDLVVVRFRNVAPRRPAPRPGTCADWPPAPKSPAPVRRSARIYKAVIRPPSAD